MYHAYNITILLRCQRFFLTFYQLFFNDVTFLCHLVYVLSKSPVNIMQKRVHIGAVRGHVGAETHRLMRIVHPLPEGERIPRGQALRRLIGQRVVRCVVVDPSAASFMQVIRQHGEFPVIPARNEVLDGIRHTASFLQQGRIRICNTCRDAMREFSLYRWEDRGDRDTPVKQNDHAMDDIRYFVSNWC